MKPKDKNINHKKLYIVGIDAAPLWIIKNKYKKWGLNGFGELIKNGAILNMESTLPPMTGPSWPSMYTGSKPGEHGVPDFFTMQSNYTKEVAYYEPTIKEPFWEKLAKYGIKSLIITPAMVVRLPSNKNIDMITGFPLPARFSSKKMKRISKKYAFSGEPNIENNIKNNEISLLEASSIYVKSIRKRSGLSKELIKQGNYDLVFVCFTETDRMQHFSLNTKDWEKCVMPLYQEISKFMEWIIKRAKDENARLMVVSDHGAQPIKKKFLMNGWLINKGYAKLKESKYGKTETNKNTKQIRYRIREKLIRSRLRSVYDKLPVIGKGVVKMILSFGFSTILRGGYTRIHDFDFDMKHTSAFGTISNGPVSTIYINDSRFKEGIIKDKEKSKLKKKIMKELLEIKDINGKRLIVNVLDADPYYGKTKLFITPDIFVEVKLGYFIDIFGYSKNGKLFADPEMAKSGDHIRNGIFGIIDYKNKLNYSKISRKKIYVYNLNPTILGYFGYRTINNSYYKKIV